MIFLTGAALGYVLGARAGRERYEQICRATAAVRASPRVQHAAERPPARGNDLAHRMADTAAEKAHTMAGAVAEKAPNWMPGSRHSPEHDLAEAANDGGMFPSMHIGTATNGRPMP